MRARTLAGTLAAAGVAPAARATLKRLLLLKFARSVRLLNEGDYRPLLADYAQDAVLHFHEGPHRWSGEHRGRAQIERFLQDFTRARVQGEIVELWISGAPWALTMVARFDDGAADPDGREIYANRAVLVLRTRWGKIVEQDDFYADTGRILELERALGELGVEPAAVNQAAAAASPR